MKKITIAVVAVIAIAILLGANVIRGEDAVVEEAQAEPAIEEIVTEEPKLSHRQEVWIHALEWCESRGVPEAVNPEDLDGTPSYGAWQFKPETFWYYAQRFEVPVPEAQDAYLKREHQYEVLKAMILHYDEIIWENQFPWCVKKLGRPPRD